MNGDRGNTVDRTTCSSVLVKPLEASLSSGQRCWLRPNCLIWGVCLTPGKGARSQMWTLPFSAYTEKMLLQCFVQGRGRATHCHCSPPPKTPQILSICIFQGCFFFFFFLSPNSSPCVQNLVAVSRKSLSNFPLGTSQDREVAQSILFLEFQLGSSSASR